MRRKGGETLLYALLITDICIDIAIDRELRIRCCRQKTANLRQERQQAQCLHTHRLAARIRSRHQKDGKGLPQFYVNRDNRISREKRVPRSL